MNINSKQDWENLKSKYLKSNANYFCYISDDFEHSWDNSLEFKNYLRDKAFEFLEYHPDYQCVFQVIRTNVLFERLPRYCIDIRKNLLRSVRLAFLDWMIQISTNQEDNRLYDDSCQ